MQYLFENNFKFILFLFVVNLKTYMLLCDMAEQKIKKIRKQTYPFKTMQVGDSFRVSNTKYNSMLTAYRQHNKLHPGRAIKIEATPASTGFQTITRIN